MKKILLAVLALSLAVCCFALTVTANAATDVAVSNTPTGRGYFKLEAPLVDSDFEANSLGEVTQVDNWYISAPQKAEIVSDSTGNALKISKTCEAWATDVLSSETWFHAYKDAGRYAVTFSVRPEKATMITACVRYAWGNTDLLADFRYTIQYDAAGVATGVTKETGGWTGADQRYFNEKIEVVDGIINAYFEYDVAADVAWAATAPNLTFQGANAAGETSSYTFDNIKIEKVGSGDYYNINWDVDYGTLTDVWAEQPVWANSGSVENDYFGAGVSALKINASNTGNTQVGGIVNTAGNDKKIAKDPVMTYFQFDVDVDGLTMVNVWTQGCYTAVIYNGSTWHVEGGAINLKVTQLDKGWRLSYFIDMGATDAANMEFNINTTGTGAVYIANLLVAQIDTVRAPWASSETVTYNTTEPADVAVNIDTKGKAITSVACGGTTVEAANYSYAGETLTLKAAAFDGKSGDLTFTVTTEGGSADFTVKQEQTKAAATATLVSSEPINKYVDGTVDVKQNIAFNLAGIADGHDVAVTYTAAYDSAEVGANRTITLTLTLVGNEAYLYELTSNTLQIEGCEIYALISVTPVCSDELVVKYEDGTTNVPAGSITLTLDGVKQGDDVKVTFDAAYESATSSDSVKINVTNIALTGDDAYKYTLSATSLQIDGKIIDRTVLTPSYVGEIEKRYDGTNYLNTKGMKLTLATIADGDEVSVTFKAAFASAVEGDRQVLFTDLALTGKDAYKYKLSSTTYEKTGYIIPMEDVAISDNRGYYTIDGQTLQKFDFENVTTGGVASNAINGLYLSPSGGEVGNGITQTASVEEESGNKVLKIEENCFTWATQLFSTNTTGIYREAGIYAVSFKIKPVNAKMFIVEVRNSSANNATGILAEYRKTVTNDASGKALSVSDEKQGWLGANQKNFNSKAEVGADGWIDCYFEFELPEGTNFENNYYPQLIFSGASFTEKAISTYYFDDVAYLCKSTSDKYMTIDYDLDMEGIDGEDAIDTPFGSLLDNGFVYDNSWTEVGGENTVIRLDVPANTAAERVGVLKNRIADGDNKLFLGEGVHFVSFDFDMTCSHFKLFSIGEGVPFNYFAISCENSGGVYNFSVECYDGWISNFKTETAANGMTRVSFIVDMTGSDYNATELILEASTGSSGGELYFDNLFVSHEDYTPVATDAEYNLVGTQDVVFNAYLKGAKFSGLELDGTAVATDKYVYDAATNTITLDKSLFVTDNPNVAARVLTIKTSKGDINAKAKLVDNRTEVTLSLNYTGDPIAKDYDGTTTVVQDIIDAIVEQIAMSGVATGDDVDFTYEIAYSSKDAGAVTIEITDIALTGAQADNYKLATTTLSVEATINKIQLTVSGTTAANKEYDGNTNATATTGTLGGVLAGENVILNVESATFNSKNVADANKVTVVYSLSGANAANYIAPVSEDITGVSISKKAVTVTAEAKSMTVGETEPALTYTTDGLVAGDTLTGTLAREEGTEAGQYNILQGTLSGGDNYQINFVSAKLTINEKPAEPEEPKGLSAGAIAGITIGAVAVTGGAAAAVVFFIRKRRLK